MGETFRFSKDEDDHDHEICAYAWPIVILSGKLDSRRHSTTRFCKKVVEAETSYQILEVLSFWDRRVGESITSFNKDNTQC